MLADWHVDAMCSPAAGVLHGSWQRAMQLHPLFTAPASSSTVQCLPHFLSCQFFDIKEILQAVKAVSAQHHILQPLQP